MDLLKLCRHRIRTVLALLAVAGSAGRMYALTPTLTLSANTVSISCNTSTGPGPAATIIVKLSTSPSAQHARV